MTMFDAETLALAKAVLERCEARGFKLATAESCTGGLVAAALTEIPGSSAVVDRAIVTYSNQSKIDMLGVTQMSISSQGAVSETVAREMAAGALERLAVDVAIATTGVAGPGGATLAKPIGRVHVAVVVKRGRFLHNRFDYGEIGRAAIRLATVRDALDWTLKTLP
jgi:nicotinamide-nucleotide amidase